MKKLSMEQRIVNVMKARGSMTATAIVRRASVARRERERLYRELDRLRREGKIARDGDGFVLTEKAPAAAQHEVEATVTAVHERFGFARPDGGEELFLPGRTMRGALPGDRVLLRVRAGRGDLMEGEVARILTEADTLLPGVYKRTPEGGVFAPDSGLRTQVPVLPGKSAGARDGDKVVARICRRGERHRDHRAQIVAALGSAQDARACAAAVLKAGGITPGFPQAALDQARAAAQRGIGENDLAGRLDLRGEEIFTIDGATAKDLDDAISLKKTPGGWELGVHIADVGHYVPANSPLDAEAFERGTSIYFADQVVPMLPPELSNGICSLNAGEDRLAFSALMRLGPEGELQGARFCKSVIRSRVRGVYSEVNALLEDRADAAMAEKYAPELETLRALDALASQLRAVRARRGAIDLSSVESVFAFDENGVVCGVAPHETGRSEGIVEECMLLCNRAAARLAGERKLPFVYRVHENPPEAKIDALCDLLRRLGVAFPPRPEDGPPARWLQSILESVRGGELEPVVNGQILRSMAKARYSEENLGHYGLVLPEYCHFTSPIRRYPDLAIHRVLADALSGGTGDVLADGFGGRTADDLYRRYDAFVHAAADQSSARELRAMTIERTCESCFMAQYMAGRIGQVFDGVISSAAPHGLYVLLENSVEGLVHLNTLEDDAYSFDGAVALTGRWSGKRYRVGDAVRVAVIRADVSAGQVDFALARD